MNKFIRGTGQETFRRLRPNLWKTSGEHGSEGEVEDDDDDD